VGEVIPAFAFPDYAALYKEQTATIQNHKKARTPEQNQNIEEALKQLMASEADLGLDMIKAGAEAYLAGATCGEITSRFDKETTPVIQALSRRRAAELFETLRDAAESYAIQHLTRPKLFLANMGSISQYKARADFSQAFFQVGGFDVIYPQSEKGQGFATPAAAIDAAVASGAKAVVICSTDETYPELVPAITRGLKERNPQILVILAGFPKDQVESYRQEGVDEFIFLGADAYQVLAGIMKKMGVLS